MLSSSHRKIETNDVSVVPPQLPVAATAGTSITAVTQHNDKFVICITGFNSREEKEAIAIINQLGCIYSKHLNAYDYCLIVNINSIGKASQKYEKAIEYNIPTVKLQWLIDCHQQHKLLNFQSYKVRPLVGCVIACTYINTTALTAVSDNSDTDICNEIISLVYQLGGECTTKIDSSVTCMIVHKVCTKKYEKAIEYNIPTVELQWLIDCHQQHKLLDYQPYKVRPLLGCIIGCTQLDKEQKNEMSSLIESSGGTLSLTLDKGITTHLIANEPTGEKFRFAKLWGLHIVTAQWVHRCINDNSWVPERLYPVLSNASSGVSGVGNSSIMDIVDAIQGNRLLGASINKNKNTDNDSGSGISNSFTNGPTADVRNTYAYQLHDIPSHELIHEERRKCMRNEIFFIKGFAIDIQDAITRLIIASGGRKHHVLTHNVTKIIIGNIVTCKLPSSLPWGAVRMKLSWLIDSVVPGFQPVIQGQLTDVYNCDSTEATLARLVEVDDHDTSPSTAFVTTAADASSSNSSSSSSSGGGGGGSSNDATAHDVNASNDIMSSDYDSNSYYHDNAEVVVLQVEDSMLMMDCIYTAPTVGAIAAAATTAAAKSTRSVSRKRSKIQ